MSATAVAEGPLTEEFPQGFTPEVTPTAGAKKFRVEHGDKSQTVLADDWRQAWAIFCDSIKSWPNPKTGKVFDAKGKQVYPAATIKQIQETTNKDGVTKVEYATVPNPVFASKK